MFLKDSFGSIEENGGQDWVDRLYHHSVMTGWHKLGDLWIFQREGLNRITGDAINEGKRKMPSTEG